MEDNKLLADFMGYKAFNDELLDDKNLFIQYSDESLKFNSDWNLLMLVVEKIENYNDGYTLVIIEDKRCHIDTRNGYKVDTICQTKIIAVHGACCGFIEWYNKNNFATLAN